MADEDDVLPYVVQVCIDTDNHNVSCDEDGYCNWCRHQYVPEQ